MLRAIYLTAYVAERPKTRLAAHDDGELVRIHCSLDAQVN